jgi:hypothetical protein
MQDLIEASILTDFMGIPCSLLFGKRGHAPLVCTHHGAHELTAHHTLRDKGQHRAAVGHEGDAEEAEGQAGESSAPALRLAAMIRVL